MGYQIAQIDGDWWVNKVGAYMAWPQHSSSGAEWPHCSCASCTTCSMVDWAFVFVDDFCTLAPSLNHGSTLHLCPSGNLLALGTPVSWKKTLLGPINTWLGLVIQPAGPIVQMDKENTTRSSASSFEL